MCDKITQSHPFLGRLGVINITFNFLSNILNKSYKNLNYHLYENAVTVLKKEEQNFPIKNIENEKIAYIKLGDDKNQAFLNALKTYAPVTEVYLDSIPLLLKELKGYSKVIVGFHKADGAWKKHNFETNELAVLDSISRHNNVVLAVFAKPYTLLPINYFGNIKNVVLAYQNNDIAQTVAGEIIFGATEAKGKIPVLSIRCSASSSRRLTILGSSETERSIFGSNPTPPVSD